MAKSYSFVFFSWDQGLAVSLVSILEPLGTCYLEEPRPELLRAVATEDLPDVALFDFVPDNGKPDKLQASIDFVREVMKVQPALTCVAVGKAADPQSTLAVLRTGIREFVDIGNESELLTAMERMLRTSKVADTAPVSVPVPGGVLIQGVRSGVGTSTLAVHVASLLQEEVLAGASASVSAPTDETDDRAALAQRVALLDFGVPVADGMMYMNAAGSFNAKEAFSSIDRLDATMLRAAMAHDRSGLSVLPLPRGCEDLNAINPQDVGALCQRLQSAYAMVVADVGGWDNDSSVAALGTTLREYWLVTDQSIGALVSLADRLERIGREGVPTDRLYLVVNRYDSRYGLTARQIAERFNLTLKGTLPDRTLALRQSSNRGQLLHHVARRDPYVRAVHKLLSGLLTDVAGSGPAAGQRGVAAWFKRRFRRVHA